MKAVVAQIKGRDVAALTNEGCVIKIKNKDYTVGQVIELKAQASKKPAKIVAWAASAAAAIVLVSASAWAYFSPYTYVSLDVNPSIEYSVNRFDRVLSASAVNGDGKEILQSLDLNNKTIDEAIKETVDGIKKAGYFEGTDPGGIEIATSSDDQQKSENLANELKTTVLQGTKGTASPVEVEAISVVRQRVLDAKKLRTTPGKLNLVQKLQASVSDPNSIDLNEWLKQPVKAIRKAIKENKNASGSNSTDKKKESDGSSSSEAGKNGKTSGSVQQTPNTSGNNTGNQNNGTSPKANGNETAANNEITGTDNNGKQNNTNNGTNGTDSKVTQDKAQQGTTGNVDSESAKKKIDDGDQNQGNPQNNANNKSKENKNKKA